MTTLLIEDGKTVKFILNGDTVDQFKELVRRGIDHCADAHADMKTLADVIISGEKQQDHHRQANQPQAITTVNRLHTIPEVTDIRAQTQLAVFQRAATEHEHALMVEALKKPAEEVKAGLSAVKADAVHMALGIAGEAGELIDAIKKFAIYGKELDIANVEEELGDLEWYMEGLRQLLGLDRFKILEQNTEKLMKKRYPNGYTDAAAILRADKEQRT